MENILKLESFNHLIDMIYQDKEYKQFRQHFYQIFLNYACDGYASNLENDINKLFSKTDGIPYLFSHITFKNNNTSIYTNSKKVELELSQLNQKYFNKFNWHIQNKNPQGILNKFYEINSDILTICKKYLKRINR